MENKDIKYYTKSHAQDIILLQEQYSLHKGTAQITFFFTVDKELDWDVLRKAVDIEIERNDSLRIKIKKDKSVGGILQTFVGPYKYKDIYGEIPLVDFTGKTEKEQKDYIQKRGSTELKYEKFELFNVIFLKTFDGKYGVFFSVSHMVCDAWGAFITMTDLLDVYNALTANTEMPVPLASFEKCLEKDLKNFEPEKIKENKEFFTNYISRYGLPKKFTDAIDKKLPHKLHEGKGARNPYFNAIKGMLLDASDTVVFKVSKELLDKWVAFCNENSVTLTTLILFGIFAYCAKLDNENDFTFNLLCNSRATLSDKHSAGTRVSGLFTRNKSEDTDTALDILNQLTDMQSHCFRHTGMTTRELTDFFFKDCKFGPYDFYGNITVSNIHIPYKLPDDWKCDLEVVSSQHSAMALYIYTLPDFLTGGLKFGFEYQKQFYNEIQINALFDGLIKAINTCVDNKDLTLKQIKESL